MHGWSPSAEGLQPTQDKVWESIFEAKEHLY